jgi:hypothetical protein
LEFRRDLYAFQTKQLEKVCRDLASMTKDRDLWKADTDPCPRCSLPNAIGEPAAGSPTP